jgi:hypothetical protein
VRAGVVNQSAFVGKRRRAEDCPPYQFCSIVHHLNKPKNKFILQKNGTACAIPFVFY